jgi:putative transposase
MKGKIYVKRWILRPSTLSRNNYHLNNRLEQAHRDIKQRSYLMRGFGNEAWAARFCHAFDEVGQCFRFRNTMKQKGPFAQ